MLGLAFLLTSCLVSVAGHGYLLDPVARSSAWFVDQSFKQCCTYNNHMEMYCGGIQHQWNVHKGKCGICGEPYDRKPKIFEKGGAMYTGRIVKNYNVGQQIDVSVVLTANHYGYFEFRVCNVDGMSGDATQECLDRGILKMAGTDSTKWREVKNYGSTKITVKVQLPPGLSCNHCVFQWKYTTGNNWGTDPVTGQSGIGMGIENETFMGCADISIGGGGGTSVVNPPVVAQTTPRPAQTTARPVQTTARPSGGATTWSANGVQYKVGNIVTYQGVKYQCIHDHVSFPGAEPSPVTWAWWKRID